MWLKLRYEPDNDGDGKYKPSIRELKTRRLLNVDMHWSIHVFTEGINDGIVYIL